MVYKKLEIRKIKNCQTCIDAVSELSDVAKRYKIPFEIKKPIVSDDFFPVVCFVEQEDNIQKKTCFEGYNNDIKNLFVLFAER